MTPALAQERPKGRPAASVTIQQIQVSFIGSGALGGGTLKYGGRSYPINVGGLGIGGIGASRLTAPALSESEHKRRQNPPLSTDHRQSLTLGDQGKGTLWLHNDKGVTMRLHTQRQGLQLSLGADGVVIGFK